MRRLGRDQRAEPVESGDLRSDLLAGIVLLCEDLAGRDGALVAGVVRAMRSDAELARLVKTQFVECSIAPIARIADHAITRGDLPPSNASGLLGEVVPALLLARLLVTGEPLDRAFGEHLVDDIVLRCSKARATRA